MNPHLDGASGANAVQLSKEQVLAGSDEHGTATTELVRSWERSHAALGTPGNVEVKHTPESLLDEHLLEMFHAPLTKFAQDLEGTGLGLLLADSRGQILQRWYQDRQAMSHFDRVGTVRGAVLAENVVGTNGVGTVVATGRALQIKGEEHFAEFYQDAVCTGAPVLHPITGKLMAVVTLSCDLTPRSDLLKPLVRSMTTQLEQHLMSVEHPDAREMLGAFVSLTRQQPGPVVAFGPLGIMIQSSTASTMSDHDKSLLQVLAGEGRPSGRYAVELSSGLTDLNLTRIGRDNSVISVAHADPDTDRRRFAKGFALPRVVGRSPGWLAVANQVDRLRDSRELVILVGEAGVGKTTLALGTPFKSGLTAPNSTLIDAAQRHILGTREWLTRLADALESRHNLVLRGIETLDAPALDGARSLLDSRTTSGAVFMTLTADAPEELEPHILRFAAQPIAVPPLRDRILDLEELWVSLVAAIAPTSRMELSPEAAELLRMYDWPGNVKELRQVINQLTSSGRIGKIVPSDLPTTMQNKRTLSLIERVELEAIRKALVVADGNRMKAADILGISRATVYRKIKAYRLGS